jgi:Fe-S cluster assembly protein SufD
MTTATQEQTIDIAALRSNAKTFLASHSLPNIKDEEWRFSNLRKYFNDEVVVAATNRDTIKFPEYYHQCTGHKLVLVNGLLCTKCSDFNQDGFEIKSVAAQHEHIGKNITQPNFFTALNDLNFPYGLHIEINGTVNKPISIFHISTDNGYVFPRVFVNAGRNSSATINEFYFSEFATVFNVISEINVAENAVLNWHNIQQNIPSSRIINTAEARISSDARFSQTSIIQNSAFVRNNIHARLIGENGHASLAGFYHTNKTELADNHVLIDHQVPNCESHQLFKGLLDGESTGVFNGKIFVHQDAQKTNAFQSSKAVLLSENAIMHSKPQLEIFADDVKCSHGAAIGQMNKNELFYFKARGIDEQTAKSILNFAYSAQVYEHIKDESLKNYLLERLRKEAGIDF